MEPVAIAARLSSNEITKDLAVGSADSIACRFETICISNCHGKGRLHSGRRCLPMLDSCDWPARSFVFIRAVACFMPGLAATMALPLVPFLLGLPAVLREMAVSAAVGTLYITPVTRRHIARRLPRPIGCPPPSGPALAPPSPPGLRINRPLALRTAG